MFLTLSRCGECSRHEDREDALEYADVRSEGSYYPPKVVEECGSCSCSGAYFAGCGSVVPAFQSGEHPALRHHASSVEHPGSHHGGRSNQGERLLLKEFGRT